MRIVNLDNEVGDGELELMDPQPPGLGARRKGVAGAEKQQNVRRLADRELAAFEERRRERRMLDARAVKETASSPPAAGARQPRHIEVICPGLFEREAHEFAAPLNAGPVVKLIAHDAGPLAFGWMLQRNILHGFVGDLDGQAPTKPLAPGCGGAAKMVFASNAPDPPRRIRRRFL
jgi:hypothetical protein